MTERSGAQGLRAIQIVRSPRNPLVIRRDTVAPNEPECVWPESVSWQTVFVLREELFEMLIRPDCIGVRLDVRAVKSIDNAGVGLLLGANRRATELGRRLVLIDSDGSVTAALSRMHLLQKFLVKQVAAPLPARASA